MTNWVTGLCETNGTSIHYLRTGGSKPPLVLLHGLTGSGACWIPLARGLEGEYDVLMPDARGHGNSGTPLSGYRYEDYAGDVVGLIQGLGLTAPVLLGHSMGGLIAAVVASQFATAVRGVVWADPTFLSPERQREVHESDVVEQHRRLLTLDKEDALAQARVRHAHRRAERLTRIAVGLPIFLGLEVFTTTVQLLHNLPEASALLAGEKNPLTLWERWSRFLEAGGLFVTEACAVVLTKVIAQRVSHRRVDSRARLKPLPERDRSADGVR
jgi:pimeloyl-ACP methyl ester carboxylesterase